MELATCKMRELESASRKLDSASRKLESASREKSTVDACSCDSPAGWPGQGDSQGAGEGGVSNNFSSIVSTVSTEVSNYRFTK